MVTVRTLGFAVVEIGRKRLGPSSQIMFGLAVFLAARKGEQISRRELAEFFWPDAEEGAARHSLRQILYRLRKAGFPLVEDNIAVGVNAAAVRCDLPEVLAPSWPTHAGAQAIENLGDFLPGSADGAPGPFRDWIDAQRSQVEKQVRRAALNQIAQARREARWSDLDRWARLVLRSDPLSEEATFACAESAAMTGSKVVALEILDRYVEEVADRSQHVALPASVLRKRIAERGTDWGSRSFSEVSLVGRSEQIRRVTSLIDGARGSTGGAILLSGAPGIGKSRICAESRAYAELQGIRATSVRADPAHAGRPLAVISEVAAFIHDLPGVAACPPTAMAVLRRIVSESNLSHFDPTGTSHTSLSQIAWALTEALAAASHECTAFIHVDDIHNADDYSASILCTIAVALAKLRVCLVATVRSRWLDQENATAGRWRELPRLVVPPLTLTESRALAAALSSAHLGRVSEEAETSVINAAGGNPLFIYELTNHHASGAEQRTTPLSLARAIEQRVSQMNQRETRLLRAITLLGPLATLPLVRTLLAGDSMTLAGDLELLESEGLVRLDDSGVLNIHECWREAVDAGMTRGARAALALECATALRGDLDAPCTLQVSWHAAHLFATGGDAKSARLCYSDAGDKLLAMGVAAQAIHAYELAHAQAKELTDSVSALVSMGTAQHSAFEFANAANTCRLALESMPQADESFIGQRATALALLVDAEWKASNSLAALDELAKVVLDPRLPAQQKNFCALLGIRISAAHDLSLSRVFADAVVVGQDSPASDWVGLLVHLIYEAEVGEPIRVHELARILGDSSVDRLPVQARLMILRYRSVALRFAGDIDGSVPIIEGAVALAQSAGLDDDAISNCLSLACTMIDNDTPARADKWLTRARELAGNNYYDERHRAIRHATSRFLIAVGRSTECLQLNRHEFESISTDPMLQRRAVESACIVSAAAEVGEIQLAKRAMDVLSPLVRSLRPSFQMDYATDALVTALRRIGEEVSAEGVLHDYLSRRATQFNRRVAPAHRELRRRVSPPQ